MEKSAKILNLIGFIIEVLLAVLFIFILVIGILILTPDGQRIVRDGLIDGKISWIDPSKTLEENIELIRITFIIFDIALVFIILFFIAASVFAILLVKKEYNRVLVILALIFSILGFNPILIASNILFLLLEDTQTLEVK